MTRKFPVLIALLGLLCMLGCPTARRGSGDDDDGSDDDDSAGVDDDDDDSDDDDVVSDDDDVVSDDDDAVDDDDVTVPEWPLEGVAVELAEFLPNGPAAAMGWALEAATWSWQGFPEQLRDAVDARVVAGCPVAGGEVTELPVDCWSGASHTITTSTWSGSCETSSQGVSGTATHVHDDYWCDNSDESMIDQHQVESHSFSASSLLFQPLPDAAEGVESLRLDGSASWSMDSAGSSYGGPDVSIDWQVEMTVERDAGSSGASWPEPPVRGLTEFGITGTYSGVEYGSYRSRWGTAAANVSTFPWEATLDLDWAYDYDAPDPCAGAEGAVSVTGFDAPGGAGLFVVAASFEGASACDGCGSISLDGEYAGTWCSSLLY